MSITKTKKCHKGEPIFHVSTLELVEVGTTYNCKFPKFKNMKFKKEITIKNTNSE